MTIEEILRGESSSVEFKGIRLEARKYMKTVIAFSNGKGGYLVFGIEDQTRKIIGIPEEQLFQEMDAITNAVSDMCQPMVIPDIYPYTIDGKTVIIVNVPSGRQRPYYLESEGFPNGVYIRVAGTTRHADQSMIRQLYFDTEGRSYDSLMIRGEIVTDDEIKDLCLQMKEVALSESLKSGKNDTVRDLSRNNLLSWGILAEDETGQIRPTNAYNFLLGKDSFHSVIQCGVFKGTTRAVFLDRREYTGPLWQQINDAHQFVLRNIRCGMKIKGIFRQDVFELPPDGIRELIINAVMNYSYLQSSRIQINIFDDRLEVTTPGGLMPTVTIEKMKAGYSQIRNKALASAFQYMKLIESWGTGIPRLLEQMAEYGLRQPEFIDWGDCLRINLFRHTPDLMNSNVFPDSKFDQERILDIQPGSLTEIQINRDDTKIDAKSDTKSDTNHYVTTMGETNPMKFKIKSGVRITEREIAILEAIQNNPLITQKELTELTEIPLSSIKRIIPGMQIKGILKREGTKRSGKWRIID